MFGLKYIDNMLYRLWITYTIILGSYYYIQIEGVFCQNNQTYYNK